MMRSFTGILICLSLAACATPPAALPTMSYSPADLNTDSRLPASKKETSYVSVGVPLKTFEKIRQDLELSQKVTLKSRGEAHITLITPPEMKSLRKTLSFQDIETVIKETKVMEAPYQLLCVGRGRLKEAQTYFVVVQSDAYYAFRKSIQNALQKKHGKFDDFNPEAFYPHVTVGFTDRDLHLEDGVVKDATSCIYSLKAN